MLAVIKRPNEDPEMVDMENTLDAFQTAVGGYIETVGAFGRLVCVINEEGRLMGLEPNLFGMVGPLVFVGRKGEEFRGLTEEEAVFLMGLL